MKTSKFLIDYIQDSAIVTIANDKGSILYTGLLEHTPYSAYKNTYVVNIEGLGSESDIIITVSDKEPLICHH